MDVLLQLNLAQTRAFFSSFFSLSDFHWQVRCAGCTALRHCPYTPLHACLVHSDWSKLAGVPALSKTHIELT